MISFYIKAIIILTIILVGAYLRLDYLHHLDSKDRITTDAPATEVERLFDALKANNLLTVGVNGKACLMPADAILAQKAADAGILVSEPGNACPTQLEKQASFKKKRLLNKVYTTQVGKILRQWLIYWNNSRQLTAIRDNRPSIQNRPTTTESQKGSCSSLELRQMNSAWKVQCSNWYHHVPPEFGYVLNKVLEPGFGKWLATKQQTIYTTELDLAQKYTLTLQIIGVPGKLVVRSLKTGKKLKTNPKKLACYPKDSKYVLGGGCIIHKRRHLQALAYQLRLTLSPGRYRLELPIQPVLNQKPDNRNLPIALKDDSLIWNRKREDYGGTNKMARPFTKFVVRTRDGQALTDKMGCGSPRPIVADYGLTAFVGYSRNDYNTLSGLIARSAIPSGSEVRLTLDSPLQDIAQKELKNFSQRFKKNTKKRRAAVVILDAKTGAILAAANIPSPVYALPHWDRTAFAVTWPDRDPFRFTPWQGLSVHSTPGSTFKLVTALAAIKASQENPSLKKMLEGLNPRNFYRMTKFSINASCYKPSRSTSKICNFNKNGMLRSLTNGKLGLPEAIRDSLNIWFVRLGVLMDKKNLDSGGPDTWLAKQARALGFGETFSLFPKVDGLPNILACPNTRGDALCAATGNLDLYHSELGARLQRLAQNSFGQGVQTTPLQMARLALTLATGRLFKPTLLQDWPGQTFTPEWQNLSWDPKLIKLLHQGMKAVPIRGTARRPFANSPNRSWVYGKTGTAQTQKIKNSFLYSGWFIGWRNTPTSENDKVGKPEIAFACMISHLPDRYYGGNSCGKIMAKILDQWPSDKSKSWFNEGKLDET